MYTGILKVNINGEWVDIPAMRGKSAYEYAKDGGYTGTEAEFAERLAFLMNGAMAGYVDGTDIVLSGDLAPGTYTFSYLVRKSDGTTETVTIGSYTVEDETEEPSYTNLLPLSVDADGNDYKGENGEDGYKTGYRLSKSANGTEVAQSDMCCSGFIPIPDLYQNFCIKNITQHSSDGWNFVLFYDSSKTYLTATTLIQTNAAMIFDNGVYKFSAAAFEGTENAAFIRFTCGVISSETIVTFNEEIV